MGGSCEKALMFKGWEEKKSQKGRKKEKEERLQKEARGAACLMPITAPAMKQSVESVTLLLVRLACLVLICQKRMRIDSFIRQRHIHTELSPHFTGQQHHSWQQLHTRAHTLGSAEWA